MKKLVLLLSLFLSISLSAFEGKDLIFFINGDWFYQGPQFEEDGDGNQILDDDGNPIPILVPELEPINIAPTLNVNGARFSPNFFSLFDAGGTHQSYLSPAELKLLSEWADIGAQYYNNPFAAPLN